MIILNKKTFFALLPKLNFLLIFSAALLTVNLYSSISRTYDSTNVRSKNKMARPVELMAKGAPVENAPLFQEGIFNKKPLFTQGMTKKPEPEKKVFSLRGVSVGKKNIAVIRDTGANKEYYCSEGDMIGDYRVKEISRDKVVLESTSGILEITR
jgi:type II secretory pathway component PulC